MQQQRHTVPVAPGAGEAQGRVDPQVLSRGQEQVQGTTVSIAGLDTTGHETVSGSVPVGASGDEELQTGTRLSGFITV